MKAFSQAIFILVMFSITAFLSVAWLSCKKDNCKSVVCANDGVCNGGSCTCAAGYYGPNCDSLSRSKFLGAWSVTEKGSLTDTGTYTIIISSGSKVPDIIISNFYNLFTLPVTGYVSGDSLFLPIQQIEGKLVLGKGYMYPNTSDAVTMSYEVIDTTTQLVNDFGYNSEFDSSRASQWSK